MSSSISRDTLLKDTRDVPVGAIRPAKLVASCTPSQCLKSSDFFHSERAKFSRLDVESQGAELDAPEFLYVVADARISHHSVSSPEFS